VATFSKFSYTGAHINEPTRNVAKTTKQLFLTSWLLLSELVVSKEKVDLRVVVYDTGRQTPGSGKHWVGAGP